MLGAGTEPADEQGRHKQNNVGAETGKDVTETGKRRAESEDTRRPEPFSQNASRNLESGQRAGKHSVHEPKGGKTEPKFALPDRQHHVDEISVPVVQRMCPARDAKGLPLRALDRVWFGRRRF